MSEKLLDKLCPDCRKEAVLWFDENRDKIKEIDKVLASVKRVSDAFHKFLDEAEQALQPSKEASQ